jgi:hypothetical protein
MGAIVFGSPEAQAIVQADRARFGDSRYPGEDGEPKPLHKWRITTCGSATVTRVYRLEACSEEEARAMWEKGAGDYDEQDVDDPWGEGIEKVEDLGEVEEA